MLREPPLDLSTELVGQLGSDLLDVLPGDPTGLLQGDALSPDPLGHGQANLTLGTALARHVGGLDDLRLSPDFLESLVGISVIVDVLHPLLVDGVADIGFRHEIFGQLLLLLRDELSDPEDNPVTSDDHIVSIMNHDFIFANQHLDSLELELTRPEDLVHVADDGSELLQRIALLSQKGCDLEQGQVHVIIHAPTLVPARRDESSRIPVLDLPVANSRFLSYTGRGEEHPIFARHTTPYNGVAS